MPRIPRRLIVFAGYPVHKIWRGHNKEWNLKTPKEKEKYLSLLNDGLGENNPLQASTLMSNHTHALYWTTDPSLFSNQMRSHHSKYGRYFNKKHQRCGKVAQDRPKTCLIEEDTHYMCAVFYIHANPIRAGIVKDAKDYVYSTHKLYAFGKKEVWMNKIEFPDWYLALGHNMRERQRNYRKLFDAYLREYGYRKQTFLNRCFFGSPIWQVNMNDALRTWRRSHAPPCESAA
jgi:REP element-mobilizing transposase RayT